jgi:glycogen debranching enzyme
MPYPPAEKHHRLSDPIATTGDRVYAICSQNGLFPDPWGGHVPQEMWGVWGHPIKLLDGFWFALRSPAHGITHWLTEATACRTLGWQTEFDYTAGPFRITRRDAVPDGIAGMTIALAVSQPDPRDEPEPLELVALFRSDLRPAWLGEQAGMIDARDSAEVQAAHNRVIFGDGNNPWSVIVGADAAASEITTGDDLWAVQRTAGLGTSTRFVIPLHFVAQPGALAPVASVTFFVAGSAMGSAQPADPVPAYEQLRVEAASLLETKRERYAAIAQTSELVSPDAALDEAFRWAKLNFQMLARAVPPYGVCVGAGLPEYPWWFGIDTEYAVLPMLQAGLFELTRESLLLLARESRRANPGEPGRVIHELATVGVVFNAGNLVETPAFTRAVHQYWLWTGDDALLRELYPFCKQGVLDYALRQCDPDGDLCPSGRSIIETLEMHAGFEVIDVAAYTWEALARLADLARAAGDEGAIPELNAKAEALGNRIRAEWWLEGEGLFADVRASVSEVRAVLQRLLELGLAEGASRDLRRQVDAAQRLFAVQLAERASERDDVDLPWLLRHWAILAPVEVGLATPEQARRALERMESDEFCDEWGMCLHPDRHDVMGVNTGMLALAEARHGRLAQALRFMRNIVRAQSYRTPGATSEALPDQWCFVQLWNGLGVIAPVVEQFLGIEPRAAERRLRVTPHLPDEWERARLNQLRVGATHFDIAVERVADSYRVRVDGDDAGYALEIGCYVPGNVTPQSVTLNGAPVEWRIETTQAGRCLVCHAQAHADLRVQFARPGD